MSSVSMTLVGKEQFLKKDKSGYWYKIHYVSPFSDKKKEKGCIGFETGDSFISEECWHSIKPEHINQEFQFVYGMNEFKKAEVVGLEFIKENK